MKADRDDLQHFVDQLAEKLGRSVAMDNRHRQYVTCSRHFGDLDGLRVNVLLSRQLDQKSSAYLYGFVDAQSLRGPIRVPENSDLGITVRRCYPVRKNEEWVGFLWLIGEATEAEDEIVEMSLPQLALILSREPPAMAQQEAVVLAAFLEALSNPTRRQGIEEFWNTELIDPQANVAIIVAYAHREATGEPPLGQSLDGIIARSIREPGIIRTPSVTHGRIALTAIQDERGRSRNKAGSPLVPQPMDGLSIGLSDWAPITESEESLTRATLAAYVAFVRKKHHLTWHEYNYQGILLRSFLDAPNSLIPEPVTRLSETASGAALIKTLAVFLEECGDITKTSQRLNIHRTTLYYRLSRVEEQTGYDLKNGSDRLDLRIGVGLLSFRDSGIPPFLHS